MFNEDTADNRGWHNNYKQRPNSGMYSSAVGVEGHGGGLEVVPPGGLGAAVPVDGPGHLRGPPDGVEHRGGEEVRGEHGHGDEHGGHASREHAG